MALVLEAFTTPANTQVIADTAAPPGSLPTAAVPAPPAAISPLVDGSSAYIWSPNDAPAQTVTFRSTFGIGTLPLLTVALPIAVYYAFAANETATVTATLEIVNLLGIVVQHSFIRTGASSDSQNVDISQETPSCTWLTRKLWTNCSGCNSYCSNNTRKISWTNYCADFSYYKILWK